MGGKFQNSNNLTIKNGNSISRIKFYITSSKRTFSTTRKLNVTPRLIDIVDGTVGLPTGRDTLQITAGTDSIRQIASAYEIRQEEAYLVALGVLMAIFYNQVRPYIIETLHKLAAKEKHNTIDYNPDLLNLLMQRERRFLNEVREIVELSLQYVDLFQYKLTWMTENDYLKHYIRFFNPDNSFEYSFKPHFLQYVKLTLIDFHNEFNAIMSSDNTNSYLSWVGQLQEYEHLNKLVGDYLQDFLASMAEFTLAHSDTLSALANM